MTTTLRKFSAAAGVTSLLALAALAELKLTRDRIRAVLNRGL